jgi:dTDP-glucose pyrophosphorylase
MDEILLVVVGQQIDVSTLALHANASLLDGLRAIELGGCGVAVIEDSAGRLQGLVSDGDIRRALIRGIGLDAPITDIMSRAPLVVAVGASRAHVLDLMRARGVSEVPVVDEDFRIVGLHQLNRMISRNELPNVAVIMAGGLGSRLGPMTRSVPKPMLPVAGRPVLEWIVLHLVGEGIRDIVISTGHLGDVIEEYFGDGKHFGCSISFVRDAVGIRLGSGGALGLIGADRLGCHPAVVLNGDILTRFDLTSMLVHHSASGAVMTVARKSVGHEVPYGVLNTDSSGRLEAIVEKPEVTWTVGAGIYVIEPILAARVATSRDFPMTDLVKSCLDQDDVVSSWEIEGDWIDIGRPEDLARARGAA